MILELVELKGQQTAKKDRRSPQRPLAPETLRAYPLATMTAFLVVLHVLVSLFLILFVLLQPGARGGVGAAFGGAGGQTVFGGRGANTFLAKLTAAAAVVFMLTSITLSFFGSSSSSVMAGRGVPAATTVPAPAEAANGVVPAEAAKPGIVPAEAASPGVVPPAPAEAAAPVGDAPPDQE